MAKYQEPHILWASWEKNLRLFDQNCMDYFTNKCRWWKRIKKQQPDLFHTIAHFLCRDIGFRLDCVEPVYTVKKCLSCAYTRVRVILPRD